MDVDDVDQHQVDNDGVDLDERLGSLDDPGCDVDEQDEDQSSDSDSDEGNEDSDEAENDEESDGDESEMEQLGFSEL